MTLVLEKSQILTLQQVLADAFMRFRQAGIPSALLDARLLLSHATHVSLEAMIRDPARPLSEEDRQQFSMLVERRLSREPLAYITGIREFWSLPFRVNRNVLIPRPETETLVGEAIRLAGDRMQPLRILDLGTGTGCLLLSLLSELPNATGVGIDYSAEALALAETNAHRHGFTRRAQFVQSDWGAELVRDIFDIVVSNPPYIPDDELHLLQPEVALYEPRLALSGGVDGLDAYRALAVQLSGLLKKNGTAFLEVGIGQAAAVVEIFEAHGLCCLHTAPDLAGVERCVALKATA